MRKAILISCALLLAANSYGGFSSLGVQGGLCFHYLDEEEYKIPDIGVSVGIKPLIMPFSIVGNANLNWRTQGHSVNVMSLSLALRYDLGLPLNPLKFYLGMGVGGDWEIGEELNFEIFEQECIQSIMGVGGIEMPIFNSPVHIFGDVRYKHLFPEDKDWSQLLISVGIVYPFI